jgi:hypothetical protein
MRAEYTAYVENPIPLQVTQSYSAMRHHMCMANEYLHEVLAVVHVEEQAHPEICHRTTMRFMAQHSFEMKIRKAEVDAMYETLHELYLHLSTNESFDPEYVHRWFCIH